MIRITLVCAPAPREVFEQVLVLPEGATAQQAVDASELSNRQPALDCSGFTPGVWGKAAAWDRVLEEGDRLELCRPLSVDPKVARRERFQKQGARGTGLFARQREGGKSGY